VAAQQPQGRNSEGVKVIRHPRGDIQNVGWLRSVTSGAYEPTTGYGWYGETQSMRLRDQSRLVRETNVSLGWLFSSVPGGVNPSLFNWQIDSLRNVRNRSLYQDGARNPAVGNSGSADFTIPLDPTQVGWPADSQLNPGKPYWTSQWTGNDWITPDVVAQFNPANQGNWPIDSQRPQKPLEQKIVCWTSSGYFVSLLDDFEFAKFPWRTDSQRVPGKPYWTAPWTGVDFIPPETSAVFDPAQESWVVDSQRVPAPPPWTNNWTGNDWLSPDLLAEIAHNPAIADWTIQTNTYQSRAWWTDQPNPIGWLVPSSQFDPTFYPAIPISSHRHWPKVVGRWQPDVDNAWLTENPVVPVTFNASFAEENNVLLEAGSVLIIPGDARGNA
jgi:hypothetical protein